MPNCADVHDPGPVGNRVQHPPVADADAPIVLAAGKLDTVGRPGVGLQPFNCGEHAPSHRWIQRRELLLRRMGERNAIFRRPVWHPDGQGAASVAPTRRAAPTGVPRASADPECLH